MAEPIIESIRTEINEFPDNGIEYEVGNVFNHVQTLRKINLYSNNKYESGEYDSEGFRKVFFNITDAPLGTARKTTDLDTKDIRLMPEDGQSAFPAWIMQKELKVWMKDIKFGTFLNETISDAPLWGSVVARKTKDVNPKIVDLKNLVLDPASESLEESPFVDEIIKYPVSKFIQVAEEKGWDNIDEVLNIYKKDKEVEVIFRLGDYIGSKRDWHIVAGVNKKKGVILAHDTLEHPYKETHWEKIRGRWLGRGIVENLFENIISENQLANMKRKAMYWSSLRVYQTKDEHVARNVLTDARNGDVLRVFSEITPLANEDRNLAAFNSEEAKWERNREERNFSFDVIRGERTPAGTPLGSAQIALSMTSGYFDLKRENLGFFIKDIVTDWVLPQFKGERGLKHIFNFIGDEFEIEKLRILISKEVLRREIFKVILANGEIPPIEKITALKQILGLKLKQKNNLELEIPAGFFENLKYKLDVVITNEQLDTAATQATIQSAMQIMASNPSIVTVPHLRRTFAMLLSKAGVNPEDILPAEQEPRLVESLGQMPRGGSIASPSPSKTPPMVLAEKTL